jgi:hypothetical protein
VAKKADLPHYTEKHGWVGGDSRTLYAFVDRRTGTVAVYPGGGAKKRVLMHWGPEADVRIATRSEGEEHWQKPLKGWTVREGSTAHARKYGPMATEKIGQTMHEWGQGKLKSSSGQKVKSQKQAIAIAISQARRAGYKVPPEPDAHAVKKKYPYIAYWIRSRGPGNERDSVPIYVLGTTTRADEGIVGYDLRVRPLRLGKGAYTSVVSPDDVEDKP